MLRCMYFSGQSVGTGRLRLAGAAVVTVLLSLFAQTDEAMAGAYKMYSCNVPGRSGVVLSASPWRALLDGSNTHAFDLCSTGGGFGLELNQQQPFMARGVTAGFELRRPEGGPKEAIGIVGYRTWINADFTGASAFVEVGGAVSPPGGSNADNAPWVSTPFPATNPAVYVLLYCATGQEACRFSNARPMTIRGIASDLYEAALPAGSLAGGTLLTGQAQRGSRTVSFNATDDESGVAKVEFLLGSAVVAVENLDADPTECPHVDWAACPSRHSGEFSVDTSSLAEGDYVGTLRVTDAAGNRRVIKHPDVITVSRSAAATSIPTVSADGSSRLTAQFATNSRSTYTTSYGRAARIRGRLTAANGQPIANASLVVTEKYDSGTGSQTRNATTGNDGKYSYRLSGRKPSRRIEIRYPGPASRTVATKLRLLVKASATLSVSLRGVMVSYKGRIITRPMPRGGKKIYIQGRAKGGAWQRFAARKTGASGRFRGQYRLRVRRPGIELQFRVEIPRQKGYAYAAQVGAPISKTVR